MTAAATAVSAFFNTIGLLSVAIDDYLNEEITIWDLAGTLIILFTNNVLAIVSFAMTFLTFTDKAKFVSYFGAESVAKLNVIILAGLIGTTIGGFLYAFSNVMRDWND